MQLTYTVTAIIKFILKLYAYFQRNSQKAMEMDFWIPDLRISVGKFMVTRLF